MTIMDFATAVTALAPLALAAVTAAVPYSIVLAERVLRMKLSTQQIDAITLAADKGAELGYGFMVNQGASMAHVEIKNAAVAMAMNYALASVPNALKSQNITPEHVERMVAARLSGLMARHAALPSPALMAIGQTIDHLTPLQPVPVQAAGDPPAQPAQPAAATAG